MLLEGDTFFRRVCGGHTVAILKGSRLWTGSLAYFLMAMAPAAILPQIAELRLQAGEAGRLMVYFPYRPDLVARIKTLPGRRWHPEKKCWSLPHTSESLARLQGLFSSPRPTLQITPPLPVRSSTPPLSPAEHLFLE